MIQDLGVWIQNLIKSLVNNSPENSLKMGYEERVWDEVLVGFSSGADPVYDSYKDLVGSLHWTPVEAFALAFPGVGVSSEDLAVISWILPQRAQTRKDNRKQTTYPSRRWVHARFPDEEFNNHLRRHLVASWAEAP